MPDDKLLKEITYEEYLKGSADPYFLQKIDHVAQFSYVAETNFLGGWDDKAVRRVIFRLQRTMQDTLKLSGFHNQSELQTRRFSDGIEFQYGDPDFSFTYSIDGAGRLRLSRRASSAKRFHEWYRRFMPSLPSIVMESLDTIDEELTGFDKHDETKKDYDPNKKRPPVIQVERASYNFQVAVRTPAPETGGAGDSIPNIRVLNHSLLRRVPSEDGTLTDPLSVVPEEFGRATYQVNRWRDPNKVLEMYQVSGPSVNQWTMLLFDFAYVGDTYIPSTGERQPFSQKAFVTGAQTTEAYLDFFRQRSVCGFMKGVLLGEDSRVQDISFSTPPSW